MSRTYYNLPFNGKVINKLENGSFKSIYLLIEQDLCHKQT